MLRSLLFLLLFACTSKPPEKPNFEETHLLFDMDTEVQDYLCPIQGEIPSWLSGTLLRNGPAKFTVDGQRTAWFDGLAMLHAFSFNNKEVHYSNRFLRSKQYYQMMGGIMDFAGFAQDPCKKKFKDQTSLFIPEEAKEIANAVVSIAKYADQMVALTETPLPVIFDPHTLATLGNFDFKDDLIKNRTFESAHPKKDGNETINYQVKYGRESFYTIWRLTEGSSTREILAEVPVDLPAYMHSFGLTQNYVILVQYPFVVKPIDLLKEKKPFIFNFKWRPERGTLFTIVDRKTGQVRTTIKTDPFFAFHHVNAYEEGDTILLDIITYPNASEIEEVTDTKTEVNSSTTLERFTLSIKDATFTREQMGDGLPEMPTIALSHTGRPYRYCYAINYFFPKSITDIRPLYKYDLIERTSKTWQEEGCAPGEPIFVPNPKAKNEDDGVILSLVLDVANQTSFLLILDAKNLQEIARAEIPHPVPLGLHGLWSNQN